MSSTAKITVTTGPDRGKSCAVIGDLFPEGATLADVTERARQFQLALGGAAASAAVGAVEARP